MRVLLLHLVDWNTREGTEGEGGEGMFDTTYEYGEGELMEEEASSGLTHRNNGDLGGFTSSAPSLL